MKQTILALILLLSTSGISWGEESIPAQFVVYGLADNGNRFERISGKCISLSESKIRCKLESTYINLGNVSTNDELKKYQVEALKKEKESYCAELDSQERASQFSNQSQKIKLGEYHREVIDMVLSMCNGKTSVEEFLSSSEKLESDVCDVGSYSWEFEFIRNSQGNYEYSDMIDLLGTGVKKAIAQTISKAKDNDTANSPFWNFSIEASYLGTGSSTFTPYLDMYTWKKPSPFKLPCRYVSLDIF